MQQVANPILLLRVDFVFLCLSNNHYKPPPLQLIDYIKELKTDFHTPIYFHSKLLFQ